MILNSINQDTAIHIRRTTEKADFQYSRGNANGKDRRIEERSRILLNPGIIEIRTKTTIGLFLFQKISMTETLGMSASGIMAALLARGQDHATVKEKRFEKKKELGIKKDKGCGIGQEKEILPAEKDREKRSTESDHMKITEALRNQERNSIKKTQKNTTNKENEIRNVKGKESRRKDIHLGQKTESHIGKQGIGKDVKENVQETDKDLVTEIEIEKENIEIAIAIEIVIVKGIDKEEESEEREIVIGTGKEIVIGIVNVTVSYQ